MYESAERRLVTSCLRRDLPVVELGASIGYITGHIGRQMPLRQVAVEANPYLLPLIEDLLRKNHLDDVVLVNGAISYDRSHAVAFLPGTSNTGGALASLASRRNIERIDVQALTLSDLLERERIDRYTLVCDIEGAEHAMILEERLDVAQRCQQLIVELHDGAYAGCNMTAADLAALVESRWRMKAIQRDGNNWVFQRQELEPA
jgi:FkbM family methyltransferase